eukprot:3726289-Pyramimonas_sp.AAC.1
MLGLLGRRSPRACRVGLARGLVALTVALLSLFVCHSPGVRSPGRGLARLCALRVGCVHVCQAPHFVGEGAMHARWLPAFSWGRRLSP